MREPPVGRVLVASLHEAISEVLPERLGFYENWLSAEGMRGGTIGAAATLAVLSFLRQESAYGAIVNRAGEYAADWTVQSMRPSRRTVTGALPEGLRRRVLLGHAGSVVRSSYEGSRSQSRFRRDGAEVNIHGSPFCLVREPVSSPLCGYYAALFARTLELFGMRSPVAIASCRGTGADACALTLSCATLSASEAEVA